MAQRLAGRYEQMLGKLFDGGVDLSANELDRRVGRVARHADLSQALRRAEAAHGQHEKRTGQRDADWPSWYAEYMVKEQSGEELPL